MLVILNPRRIAECVRAFNELRIDRLWVRNIGEPELEQRWSEILEAAVGYDRLILISDDGVVRQHALDAVRELLDEGHPVVTGYSNLDATEKLSGVVNLNRAPLGFQADPSSFSLYTFGEVMCWPERAVPTTFCGFALTGMRRELWERYPWVASGGADFMLSKRLAADGVPIVAARDAFVWHVKEMWNRPDRDPRKGLLVGVEPAAIELETV